MTSFIALSDPRCRKDATFVTTVIGALSNIIENNTPLLLPDGTTVAVTLTCNTTAEPQTLTVAATDSSHNTFTFSLGLSKLLMSTRVTPQSGSLTR